MKKLLFILSFIMLANLMSCDTKTSEAGKEAASVNRQQGQYAKGQPVPAFNWSFERPFRIEMRISVSFRDNPSLSAATFGLKPRGIKRLYGTTFTPSYLVRAPYSRLISKITILGLGSS